MTTQFYQTVFTAKGKGEGAVIEKVLTTHDNLICYVVSFQGYKAYFASEAEAYAYCEGRDFIHYWENPYKTYGTQIMRSIAASYLTDENMFS
jgi:hypothetical protein